MRSEKQKQIFTVVENTFSIFFFYSSANTSFIDLFSKISLIEQFLAGDERPSFMSFVFIQNKQQDLHWTSFQYKCIQRSCEWFQWITTLWIEYSFTARTSTPPVLLPADCGLNVWLLFIPYTSSSTVTTSLPQRRCLGHLLGAFLHGSTSIYFVLSHSVPIHGKQCP